MSAAHGGQARAAECSGASGGRLDRLLLTCSVLELPVPWRRSTRRDIACRLL